MSAIAGKAINSTLGTSNYKGLDEAILEGFNNLVTSLTPKIQTVKVRLESDERQTSVKINKVDVNRSKVEVITKIYPQQPTRSDNSFATYYISPVIDPSGEHVTIYHNSNTDYDVSLAITTYGG